jgi:hypothetical protein
MDDQNRTTTTGIDKKNYKEHATHVGFSIII